MADRHNEAAHVRIVDPSPERRVPLAANTLLGRHWSCTWPLASQGVPLFWVEIRYLEKRWWWRDLDDRAEPRNPRWQPWEPSTAIPRPGAEVVLESDGPPAAFLQDPRTGEHVLRNDWAAWVDLDGDALLPVDVGEQAEEHAPLRDGDLFVSRGRLWRLFLAEAPAGTLRPGLDCADPFLEWQFEPAGTAWRLHLRGLHLVRSFEEEAVRMGAAYALIRLAAAQGKRETCCQPLERSDGFASNEEVLGVWDALGGRAENIDVNVERSHFKYMFDRAGAARWADLFESVQIGRRKIHRLAVLPARLRVDP
jgi:hypothetical protein